MKPILEIYRTYCELIAEDTFDFDKFNQYAIVHHSNSIEGSTLTKEETFLLLDEKLTPAGKPLEHSLMAVDHLDALNYFLELSESKIAISESVLKKIAALVMKGTGSKISAMGGDFDSAKGDFRKLTVRAGTSTFMDHQKVPQRISEVLDQLNSEIKRVNGFNEVNALGFDVHFQLVSIHPFADGNGRVSRLLMNYVQNYHDMPLTVVYNEDKAEYINALLTTRKEKNIQIFRAFMFGQARKYLGEKISELTKPQIEKPASGKGTGFLF